MNVKSLRERDVVFLIPVHEKAICLFLSKVFIGQQALKVVTKPDRGKYPPSTLKGD